ncbi:hypothetical protein LJB99_04625, partial [Deltaproteobacteria bacterium OttesenSCG-928-K17]|nr:hypothetical protein [Deltaproteobacteria bacterium OttesenSCG-928-K17]
MRAAKAPEGQGAAAVPRRGNAPPQLGGNLNASAGKGLYRPITEPLYQKDRLKSNIFTAHSRGDLIW